MAEKLQLSLLGPFQVGDKPGIPLRRKNRAILAYLTLSPLPLGRLELANLFCQSAADPAHTLRLSLSRLRRKLGAEALIYDGETVQLNQAYFESDVSLFQERLGQHEWQDVSFEQLEQVVSLYRGEFLDGLHLPDAPEFEMWLVGQRSYWRQLYERGALALLKQLTAESPPPSSALPTAQRLVQQNPLLEEAHYYLIYLYAQTGQRTAALEQFNQCRAILNEELAVEPTPDLLTLYHDIQAGRLLQTHTAMPLPARLSTSAVDFVAREDEWRQLDNAWGQVQQGNCRAVLVTAEAGGGKTRLVQEWAKTLAEDDFLYSPCYETTRTLPYHPWQTILEQLYPRLDSAALDKLDPISLSALSRLIPALAEHHRSTNPGHQDQLFSAVHNFLRLLNKPLALGLDDLQWADAATLRLFHFLAVQRITPLLFIGIYRTEEADENAALLTLLHDWARNPEEIITLSLAPLTAESVAQLMQRLWPQLPEGYREPHLRDRLIQATGGNPLFVNEIIRELAGTSQLPEQLPVPPSLRDLIQRRLRALPSSGRQVLESLAILNQPAEFDLARQISGRSEEETLAALELGLRRRLLLSTRDTRPLVNFSHDLMGQAVREQLSPIRRQLLHRRTAVTLGQHETKAALLAYHWRKAGDQEQERLYAVQAGHDSAAVYAHEEAIAYWQRALTLTADTAQRVELSYHLGQAFFNMGDWEEAEKIYQSGLDLADQETRAVKADIQAAYGLLLENKTKFAEAQALEEQALAYYQSVNSRPKVSRTLGLLALLHLRQARYDEAFRITQQALADPEAVIDPSTRMRLLNIRGLINWRRQSIEAAFEDFQQALHLAEYHHERQYQGIILNNLGNIYLERGQYDEAGAQYTLALELNQEINNQLGIGMNFGNLALTYFHKGDDDKALEYGHKGVEMGRQMGSLLSVALYLSNLANSLNRLERYQEAFDYLQEALEIDADSGNPRGVMIHAGNLSTLYLLWGHTADALACLAYALHQDERLDHPRELARYLTEIAAVYLFDNQLLKAASTLGMAMPLLEKVALEFESCAAFLVQGRLQLAQEQYTAAVESLKTAQQMAQVANRTDIEFEAAVNLPRAQWLAGQMEADSAVQQYESLRQMEPTPRQQAAIYYEQWRINPTPASQTKARQAYEAALQQSYTAEADQRARELGATNLPPKTAVPPLPIIVTAAPLNLDSLLEKIKQGLTG